MWRATSPPGVSGLPEYLARELGRLEGDLRDGTVVYPTLQSGFVAFGGEYESAGFRRDHHGVVALSGMVKDGVGGTASFITVLTLPEKYRPLYRQIFAATQGGATSGEFVRLDVYPSGVVAAYNWNHTWLSLSGIQFSAGQ